MPVGKMLKRQNTETAATTCRDGYWKSRDCGALQHCRFYVSSSSHQSSANEGPPPMALPELTDSHSPPSSSRMSLMVSMRAASCSLLIRGLAMLDVSPATVSNTHTGDASPARVSTNATSQNDGRGGQDTYQS
jgi:hypothetical protein